MAYPSGGVAGPEMAKRERQVDSELNRLESAVGHHGTLIDQLENRLSRCMHAVPPEPTSAGDKIRAASVPLAEQISNHGMALERLSRRLNSLLERLEL